jgi:hypothetical protein
MDRVLKMYGLTSIKGLEEWFDTVDHPRFERLTSAKMAKNLISFPDGCLGALTMIFSTWAELKVAGMTPPLTDHWYDVRFGSIPEQLARPTPLWDSVLRLQMTQKTQELVKALIGRMQYPIKQPPPSG